MSMLVLYSTIDQLKKLPINNSPYFKWSEALYIARMNAYVKPSIPEVANIEKLCSHLDAIRKHFNQPITITSWLRPNEYNKLIGGAAFSHHRTGSAVDFTVLGLTGDQVRAELKQNPQLTAGLGLETGIVHVHIQLMPNAGPGGLWFPPPIKNKGLTND